VVERVAVKPAVIVVGSLRARWREREKRERLVAEKTREEAGFFQSLDSIFFFLRT
jgi:hypothetical protein